MSRSKALLAALAALVMALPAASAESENIISAEKIQTNTVNYDIHKAELGYYEQIFSNAGNEYYPHTYNAYPEVDGAKFVEYTVEKGQEVKKGDVLAVFAIEVDEVRVTELQLQLEQAQDDLARETELRVEAIAEMEEALPGIRDRYEYELHALGIKRAELELEQYVYQKKLTISHIEDEMAQIEKEREGAKLLAPADGVVTRTSLKRQGDRVYRNESLVTLLRTDGMLICFENTGYNFRYGMEVTVEVGPGGNKRQLPGRIVGTDAHVAEALRNDMVYVAFEDDGEEVRVAKIRTQGVYLDNVMIVPRKAVELEAGNYYVTKLEGGIARKRYVNCIVKPGQQIWILQGLEVGEEVIVD